MRDTKRGILPGQAPGAFEAGLRSALGHDSFWAVAGKKRSTSGEVRNACEPANLFVVPES